MKLLLIGMGPGNGLSIAKRFGREGYGILMVARNAEKLREFEAHLSTQGISSKGYAVDISDDEAFAGILEKIISEQGDIDILVYNASAYNPGLPSQISVSVFLSDLKINVIGALLAAQAVFPQMKIRERGTILLTGGGTAIQAPAMLASLGVGKAGMRNLAFSLAQECKPLGIHVATVTIAGMVQVGTRFDPDRIADEFWRLHQQPREDWETEVVWQ